MNVIIVNDNGGDANNRYRVKEIVEKHIAAIKASPNYKRKVRRVKLLFIITVIAFISNGIALWQFVENTYELLVGFTMLIFVTGLAFIIEAEFWGPESPDSASADDVLEEIMAIEADCPGSILSVTINAIRQAIETRAMNAYRPPLTLGALVELERTAVASLPHYTRAAKAFVDATHTADTQPA